MRAFEVIEIGMNTAHIEIPARFYDKNGMNQDGIGKRLTEEGLLRREGFAIFSTHIRFRVKIDNTPGNKTISLVEVENKRNEIETYFKNEIQSAVDFLRWEKVIKGEESA